MKKTTRLIAIFTAILVFTMCSGGLAFAEEIAPLEDSGGEGVSEEIAPAEEPAAQEEAVVAPLDAVSDAQAVADALNTGVASALIQATASGSTVTVTTKAASESAPPLQIDIPAGVTVVWQAEYINTNFVPVPTHDDGHGGFAYSDADRSLIDLTGEGLFSIQDGADIKAIEGSASTEHIRAVSSDGSSTAPGPCIEMTGGSVSSIGTVAGHALYAIRLNYASSNNPTFSLSGGVVYASGIGGSGSNGAIYGVLINHTDNAVVNITGGEISAVAQDSDQCVTLLVMQGGSPVATMTGGTLNAVNNSPTGTASGISLVGSDPVISDITIDGGIIHVESKAVAAGIITFGNLTIRPSSAIIAIGGTPAQSIDHPIASDLASLIVETAPDGSTIYADVPITGLSFAEGGSATIPVGGELLLTPVTVPAERTYKVFVWESSDPGIATVDANGRIVGISAGTVTITAYSQDFSGTTATFEITVGGGGGGGGASSNAGGPPPTGDETPLALMLSLIGGAFAIAIALSVRRRKAC